ncbi:MAG: hypothetical protein NFCOHLIN_00215 [Gammaproteobacteria bacterium]|nr:hypothetical protein [Gammaproteobacteria bacterium]
MTGYDHDKGIYTFALEEARRFHTGGDRPDQPPPMQHYAEKLRQHGFEIVSESGASVAVRASPDAVWEVLSGQIPFL